MCSSLLADLSASTDGTSGPLQQKVIIHSVSNITPCIIDMSPLFLHLDRPLKTERETERERERARERQRACSYDGLSRERRVSCYRPALLLKAHLILGKQRTSSPGLYGAGFLLLRRVRRLKHQEITIRIQTGFSAEVGESDMEYVGARKE